MSDLTGSMVINSRYKVIKRIGEGAFAEVYKARDTQGDAFVAVKIVGIAELGREEVAVLQNIQAVKSPFNRFIISALDHGYLDDSLVIVFPLMDRSLLSIVEGDDIIMPSQQTKVMCFHILGALKHLTSVRIVHSDVKPDNILVKCILVKGRNDREEMIDPQFVLCDFNSAKNIPRSGLVKGLAQTSNYRAPEVILGLDFDHKVDIFSLGAVVAECLDKKLLFGREEADPENPSESERIRHLEDIEKTVGPIPQRMYTTAGHEDFMHGSDDGNHTGTYWAPDYRENDPAYIEMSTLSLMMMCPSNIFRPDADQVLELDIFKDLMKLQK